MTKQLTILAAGAVFAAAPLLAQTRSNSVSNSMTASSQQWGWVAAPGATATSAHLNAPDGQSGPVLGKPFTATEVRHSSQILDNGTSINRNDTSSFYRDAQGRMRSDSPTQGLIYDPVGGFIYTLDLKNKTYEKKQIEGAAAIVSIAVAGGRTSVSTTSHTSNGHPVPPKPAPAIPNSEEIAPQMVNGFFAKGSRVTTVIPVGSIGNDHELKVVNERWYSDDLQVVLKTVNSDPRFGSATYDLTNIVQAPPDPTLFQVPADFKLKAGK